MSNLDRINLPAPGSEYITPANLSHVSMMWDATADWPNGAWELEQCERLVRQSMSNLRAVDFQAAEIIGIPNYTLVFHLSDDTPIGFVTLAYLAPETGGTNGGGDAFAIALLPAHRGQGLSSKFRDAIGWWLMETFTQADSMRYEAIDKSPQVATHAKNRGAADLGKADPNGREEKTKFQLNRTDYGRDHHQPTRYSVAYHQTRG